MSYVDLFGNVVEENLILTEKYIEPPFSVLDGRSQRWQQRKQKWKQMGLKSEEGRDAKAYELQSLNAKAGRGEISDTSIFDPVLCEIIYTWYVEKGQKVLDCFAGGSVRGIVAGALEIKYTGIDIRQEQVEANRQQAKELLPENNQPRWIVGDSEKVLDTINEEFDFILSCPPYFNLEVYSDLDGDISNLQDYGEFLVHYSNIINKTCSKLKKGGFACFVVGDIRDKKGNLLGFVPDTINIFKKAGLNFYNDAILLTPLGSAMLRANNTMKTKKLTKVHQYVLIFKKGE